MPTESDANEAAARGRALVCVPVCVRTARELPEALSRAAQVADVIEVRFDCLEGSEPEAALRALAEGEAARPLLYTFRPAPEGGRRELDIRRRLDFWSAAAGLARGPRQPALADFELDLFVPENLARVRALAGRCTLICSHHIFDAAPTNLEWVYQSLARTPAEVLKLAVTAESITDCIAVLRLLERARADGRALVAVAMGEAGLLTRVLGPSRGSFLTYGALDAGQATAPGQVTARELREVYRVGSITKETFVTGLVGSPVMHSLSPHTHNAAFAARGLDGVYIPLEVSDLDAFMRRMALPRTRELDWNLRGLSVTAPHKREVVKYLTRLSPEAAAVGAVNTVLIEGDELTGANTDAAACLRPVRELLELGGARAAVIGAGGAARALLWSLGESGARTTLFARDAARGRALAAEFGADFAPLAGARFDGFDLVANATPLGARGAREGETPAAADALRGARLAYDLVYNPAETRFLAEARAAGCATLGGLSMLVAQAAEQFKIWTGEEAPLEVMRAAAEKRLSDA